jgi:hypothetical protein
VFVLQPLLTSHVERRTDPYGWVRFCYDARYGDDQSRGGAYPALG